MASALALKLGGLLIKTLAKPVAKRLKNEAAVRPQLYQACVSVGNWTNRASAWITVTAAGHKSLGVARLDDPAAFAKGADFMSETFIFAVGGGVIVFEYNRSKKKEAATQAAKSERNEKFRRDLEERFTLLEKRVLELEEERRRWVPWKQNKTPPPSGPSFITPPPQPGSSNGTAPAGATPPSSNATNQAASPPVASGGGGKAPAASATTAAPALPPTASKPTTTSQAAPQQAPSSPTPAQEQEEEAAAPPATWWSSVTRWLGLSSKAPTPPPPTPATAATPPAPPAVVVKQLQDTEAAGLCGSKTGAVVSEVTAKVATVVAKASEAPPTTNPPPKP